MKHQINPDLAARQLIMLAYLYYNRSSPLRSDAEYDELSRYVAERFDELEPIRKFQLESPEAILASGHHIKMTRQGERAALAWFQSETGKLPDGQLIDSWQLGPEEFAPVQFAGFSG